MAQPADRANTTFDEIAVGATSSLRHALSASDIDALSLAAGEVEQHEVGTSGSPDAGSVQAAAAAALIAGFVNRRFPGPGSRIVGSGMRYNGELAIGDVLDLSLAVLSKDDARRTVEIEARCTRGDEVVAEGVLVVEAPGTRLHRTDIASPDVVLRRGDSFAPLFERGVGLDPVRCAIVHPCDAASLRGAVASAERGLIVPVLVGPEARIRSVAGQASIDLGSIPVVAVEHSHAAAARAVEMARAGEVDALMKGSLHTDELMAEVVAPHGLRTGRRASHVFVLDVPTSPRLLFITDAAINIEPDLEAKADICRNAIDLARVLGIVQPKVAILSAVETVSPKIPGTLDAAALCKMADRGQIEGGVLDGPLAFDNAISEAAARAKGIVSPVAGRADILLVPSLEAGNMLAKQLQYLAGAEAAGIVMGARVPIALTSRADSVRARLVSAALLKLVAHARRSGAIR